MKTLIRNIVILASALCSCNQIFAMKSSRAGTAYVGKWVRPNAKSSLRYFAISPDRGCKTTTHITPSYRKTFGSQRELSFGQIGSGLFKKARWSLTSREDKKAELFDALENNILTQNEDQTFPSIFALFKTENLLNEKDDQTSLTPLEFVIKKSRHLNPEYQENYAEAFIKNGAPNLLKALYFALENYNEGAIRALYPYFGITTQEDFFELAQKKLATEKTHLDDIISTIREEENEPLDSEVTKILLDNMGKTYAHLSKLKKIVDLKKGSKKLGDLESIFSEKESSF